MADIASITAPTISALFETAGRKFRDSCALAIGASEYTFGEIHALAACASGGLRDLGINEGDRVVLHLANGVEWIVAYYALARLGAVVVPANILLTPAETAFIILNSSASMVITAAERLGPLLDAIGEHGSSIKSVIIGDEDPVRSIGFSSLLTAAPVAAVDTDPDRVLTIGYTSGTTGRPKGAMLTHRGIFLSTAFTATTHIRTPDDIGVSALPLVHVYGNVVLHATFLTGMKLVLFPRFDAAAVLGAIEDHRATIFDGVPTMYYQMLAEQRGAPRCLASLRRCTVGGQTMPTAKMADVEEMLGCPLLELWGMTELCGPAMTHSPYFPSVQGSIGQPYAAMDIRIVDFDDPDRELSDGEPGELMVRGPLVMKGYYDNPVATLQTIRADGWMHTGDIGYRGPGKHVHIVDRKKDMIITAGYKIFPVELEQVIAMHPAVAMVAVSAVVDEIKGELAKAFVVLKADARISEEELLDHCREHLAPYKVPRALAFVAELPTTSTGKIMRRALREEPRNDPQKS